MKVFLFLTFLFSNQVFTYQIDKPSTEQQKVIDGIKKKGTARDCFKNKQLGKWIYRCINELALHKDSPSICENQPILNQAAICVGLVAKKRKDIKLCTKAFELFKNRRGHCEAVYRGELADPM